MELSGIAKLQNNDSYVQVNDGSMNINVDNNNYIYWTNDYLVLNGANYNMNVSPSGFNLSLNGATAMNLSSEFSVIVSENITLAGKTTSVGDFETYGDVKTCGIQEGRVTREVVVEIDVLDADAEVVLFSVPVGKQAMIGDSIPYVNSWYIEYEGEMDTTPELSITYVSPYDGAQQQGYLTLNSGIGDYQSTSIMSPIIGAGDVVLKVNTVPTGMTTCKVGFKTKVTW